MSPFPGRRSEGVFKPDASICFAPAAVSRKIPKKCLPNTSCCAILFKRLQMPHEIMGAMCEDAGGCGVNRALEHGGAWPVFPRSMSGHEPGDKY